jgi:hypothetical protein
LGAGGVGGEERGRQREQRTARRAWKHRGDGGRTSVGSETMRRAPDEENLGGASFVTVFLPGRYCAALCIRV